jgi:hypothetical protein
MNVQELRERFRDQMPGLAEFDALAKQYEKLLTAQQDIEQRWTNMVPVRGKEAIDLLRDIAEHPAVPRALKERIIDTLRGDH